MTSPTDSDNVSPQDVPADSITVEEVITRVIDGAEDGARAELASAVARLESEIDEPTASAWCQVLLAHLTEDPADVRALESLVVIGFAHAGLLGKNRISMPQEGRRLAVLLEKSGDVERAQALLELLAARNPGDRAIEHELSGVMRRNGNLVLLVDRHLARADEAMRDGKRDEAVRWLREVLVLDNSRRDVARMIRDLRYEAKERSITWRKRARTVALATIGALACAGVYTREAHVDEQYTQLPLAADGDAPAMQRRLRALDDLLTRNPLWLGMLAASRERAGLRAELERIESERAAVTRRRAQERAQAEAHADSERSVARMHAERYDYATALEHFRAAMEVAPDDWEYRTEVTRDIAAIVEWLGQERGAGQGDLK